MADIYEKINEYRKLGKDLVLVTVTEKEGMGPADVGKKMLVTDDNQAFGTVGGGAIEFYAREKCKEVIRNRQSFSEKYLLSGRDVYVDSDEVFYLWPVEAKPLYFMNLSDLSNMSISLELDIVAPH